MTRGIREVVLLDSDSESESSNPPKKIRLDHVGPGLGPTFLPPMRKPFMDESDADSGDSSDRFPENERGNAFDKGNSNNSTSSGDGSSPGGPESSFPPSDRPGLSQSGGLGASQGVFLDGGVVETDSSGTESDTEIAAGPASDSSESASDSSLGSSVLTEISVSELPAAGDRGTHPGTLTRDSVSAARMFVKQHGPVAFVEHFSPPEITCEVALALLKKLGFRIKNMPPSVSGRNLHQLFKLLAVAMDQVRRLRPKLEHFNTVPDVVAALRNSKKILILTGAGISTSLGIPDFRSNEGFYAQIGEMGLSDPQEVFDIHVFKRDPSAFYSIAHMILPPPDVKAPLHKFIRLLQDKGKLLRNYTQNIDNIEANAGILPEKMVQCHGSFAKATCITCKYQTDGRDLFPAIRNKEIAYCPKCIKERKRRLNRDEDLSESFGVMKPDITFFGEDLPQAFYDRHHSDLRECDLLLSIGTSLRVHPVAGMVNQVAESVPQILINKDLISDCNFDVSFLGYCDDTVSYLCDQLGEDWAIDHPDYRKIVGEGSEKNVTACMTEELGVYQVRNESREKELAKLPPKPIPGPDIVVLEPEIE